MQNVGRTLCLNVISPLIPFPTPIPLKPQKIFYKNPTFNHIDVYTKVFLAYGLQLQL